jgi:recombination associated protein RdgC
MTGELAKLLTALVDALGGQLKENDGTLARAA